MNDLLIQALKCQNTSRPPVWLMRQAGRHMPAYRALRQKYSFLEMCHHPELIAEVTLLPILTYGVDAAILFSDILVIPEALGLGLHFEEKLGPIIERPIVYHKDIDELPLPNDLSALHYVYQGIKQTKAHLQVPLIGFCGAPFTVASYMIEGKTSRELKKTKQWMLSNPESFHYLLRKIADWSIAYLNLQIEAGVQAIQIFDSWANALAHQQFREFSLSYLQYILEGLKDPSIPVILFCRGSSIFASQLAEIQPSAISLDWNCDITQMRPTIPYSIALQGNLDPDILYAPKNTLEKEINRILDGMEGDKGFIFNLGHGIFPDVPEESVRILVECVKKRALCPSISSF
jgi:uroporphyrinogen decarboxylase